MQGRIYDQFSFSLIWFPQTTSINNYGELSISIIPVWSKREEGDQFNSLGTCSTDCDRLPIYYHMSSTTISLQTAASAVIGGDVGGRGCVYTVKHGGILCPGAGGVMFS